MNSPELPSETGTTSTANAEGATQETATPKTGEAETGSTEGTSDEGVPAADVSGTPEGHTAQSPPRKKPSQRNAWLLLLVGLGLPFLLMATDRQFPFSVSLVVACLSAGSYGLLRLLGAWPEDVDRAEARSDLRPWVWFAVSALTFLLVTTLAVKGVYPWPKLCSGTLITGAFLWSVVSVFGVGRSLGYWAPEADTGPGILGRHGFWLVAITSLMYLPWLGNFGLIDPWETHYGEVSREIIARDDWISLWWAQDGWFWSKPILNFWVHGLSFKTFGVNAMPDQMIVGITRSLTPQPEWACRLPVFLMTLLGGYTLYRAMIAPVGRRAAFLGGLILATCPYWYILARQTMADMPYVAPLSAAMGLLMLGIQTDAEIRVRDRSLVLGRLRLGFNGFHLLFVAVLLCALPQILYLFSRNLTFHTTDMFGFRAHLDEFMRGSGGGNCGQPGNKGCAETLPVYVWGQPFGWALLWTLLGLVLIWYQRKERRLQRLYFLAGWFCTAIAVMAKGAPGLVLPMGTALAFIGTSGRWRDITRLELPAMFLLVLVVAMPWYVQMYMRHGYGFFDRLIMHDMVNRAFSHVHDTNKGDEVTFRYYIWQLGYGLFPWTGLCAGGLIWWAARREQYARVVNEAIVWLACWWLVAFGMFSVTLTKFHHYIFPLVPPTACIAGLLLSELLPRFDRAEWRKNLTYLGLLGAGTTLSLIGITLSLPGRLSAVAIPNQDPPPGHPALGASLFVLGALAIAVGCLRFAPSRAPTALGSVDLDDPQPALNRVGRGFALATIAIGAATAVGLAGRDMFITRPGDIEGQVRLLHLFTYNYERAFPKTLDFRPVLLAFTVIATAACLLLALPRWQRHAATILCWASALFSLWCMNVYLVKLTPHWGQRETMITYYQKRQNANEKLVAYQMNWKGENFYTGNRMATWVSSGAKFKEWIQKQREKGVRSMFFTTEHARLATLKKELDSPKQFEMLTDETLNNKFFLAHVVFDELPPAAGTGTANEASTAPGSAKKSTPTPKPATGAANAGD